MAVLGCVVLFFVGVGMVFWEVVCYCEGGLLGLIYCQALPSETVLFQLPADQDVGLSDPAHCHIPP